jgi:hypothetical protein
MIFAAVIFWPFSPERSLPGLSRKKCEGAVLFIVIGRWDNPVILIDIFLFVLFLDEKDQKSWLRIQF